MWPLVYTWCSVPAVRIGHVGAQGDHGERHAGRRVARRRVPAPAVGSRQQRQPPVEQVETRQPGAHPCLCQRGAHPVFGHLYVEVPTAHQSALPTGQTLVQRRASRDPR